MNKIIHIESQTP